MQAVITGATSGIGYEMAVYLSELGWDLILTGRNSEKLRQMQQQLSTRVQWIALDLAKQDAPFALYRFCKGKRVDLLVNNAGFGLFGNLWETDLQEELELMDVNIRALHILTKLFVKEFRRRNSGILLNVASSAGFLTGPLMASYYASKNYVVRLSLALAEELRRAGSSVSVSVLCPGPVDTNFNNRAGVSFHVQALDSKTVARYAIDGALHGKTILVPGLLMKLSLFGARLVPQKLLAAVTYHIQEQKQKP